MPRPIMYTKEQMLELIRVKEEEGTPIKKQCRELGWKYVSINRAMIRYNLLNPLKYARREGRSSIGTITDTQVALTKNQKRKLEQSEASEGVI